MFSPISKQRFAFAKPLSDLSSGELLQKLLRKTESMITGIFPEDGIILFFLH